MELIFLVYGLAFFLLGFAILYYPKKGSTYHLAGKIHFVGWFGIIHGINEWLDLLILIDVLNISSVWIIFRLLTLPVSFLFLVYFGSMVISTQKKNCRICQFLMPFLMLLWGGLFFLGKHDQQNWDILSRYVLCLPGALLTGLALFVYVPETESSRNFKLAVNLKIGGIAFIFYAFLAGLVVKDAAFFPASVLNYSLFSESLGIPVQVFRSVCAIVIAYNLIQVLKIFHLEVQQSLINSEMRFRTVVNNVPVTLFIEDEEHHITFMEGKGLSALDIMSSNALGKSTAEVFSVLPQIDQISTQVFSSGQEVVDLISCRGYSYEIFYAPLKDERDNIYGAIGVMIDVTEQKKAKKEIERYRIEMEKSKALATVGALSEKIACEITEPLQDSKIPLLRAIRGLKKTIGAGDITASIQDGLNRISEAIKVLETFGKKAELQIPPQTEPIDLYETVQRILSVFRESAQNAMVRIRTEGADIFPVLPISSREFEQVLYIMIQNVIRSADGVDLRNLNIDFSLRNEKLYVTFAESCPGRIVKTPNKVSTASPEGVGGTYEYSFDFSVVKGIVDTHAGTMTTTEGPEGGVLYEIQLPLAK